MGKLKKFLTNVAVLAVTVAICLLLCEFAARLILNPADYLGVEMVGDPILGAMPSQHTIAGGLDGWGFRNPKVPDSTDIAVIGDSQTYGNTAKMVESWPYVLGQLSGQRVYNLALGGYGPNQYFYLLQTKALKLKPKTVIIGLSLSDDFDNAYLMTYSSNYWSYLRVLPGVTVDASTWDADPIPNWQKKIRIWLSRHSVVYQLAFHTGLGASMNGEMQVRNAAQMFPGVATAIIVPDQHIEEAFQPVGNLRRLDQQSPSVQEGMRITFKLLHDMNELCKQNNIRLAVVVIPTKEMVFAPYLEHNSQMPLGDVMGKLIPNERLAMERTFQFLSDEKIPYVNPLPAMQAAAGQGIFAKSAGDMHPNKNGYRIIAESVADALKKGELGQ